MSIDQTANVARPVTKDEKETIDAAFSKSNFWDIEGREIDLATWAKLYADWNYRLVVSSEIISNDGTQAKVITVWLGDNCEDVLRDWDCESSPGYQPNIFGTMIFPDFGLSSNEFRHKTITEAKERHSTIVTCLETGDMLTLQQLIQECGI